MLDIHLRLTLTPDPFPGSRLSRLKMECAGDALDLIGRSSSSLLSLAHDRGCEAALAGQLEVCLDAGKLPDVEALRSAFAPEPQQLPSVRVELGSLADYNVLLPGSSPQSAPNARAGSHS